MDVMAPLLKPDGLYVVEFIPSADDLRGILAHGLEKFSTVHRYKSPKRKTARVMIRNEQADVQEHTYYSDVLFFEHKQEIPIRETWKNPVKTEG
jgi:hypothetical protein